MASNPAGQLGMPVSHKRAGSPQAADAVYILLSSHQLLTQHPADVSTPNQLVKRAETCSPQAADAVHVVLRQHRQAKVGTKVLVLGRRHSLSMADAHRPTAQHMWMHRARPSKLPLPTGWPAHLGGTPQRGNLANCPSPARSPRCSTPSR